MKPLFAVLVVPLLISTNAFADYQHEVARQSYCDSMGKVSEQAYMGRVLERPKQKYLDMAKEQLAVNDRNAEILRYAIDYGYDKATGLKDSNMGAWGYCMDKSK